MKLDFLISASPNQGFFSQIAFFRASLDRLGGPYAAARLVAVFGDHKSEDIPAEWRPYFDNIDVVWAHPIGATNPSYRAQHDRRFEIMRDDADLVFLCDADIAPISPFDELIDELITNPTLAGTIAHCHFPPKARFRSQAASWQELAKATLGKEIDLPYCYTLAPPDAAQKTPFYINYGMFAGTPDLLHRFYKRDLQLRDSAAALVGEYWSAQVSVALTCADLELPTKVLPMRYNFPNDPVADQRYPDDLSKIIFLHYLRTKNFRRDKIFTSRRHFRKFMNSKLTGSDDRFRRHVETVSGGHYPFPR